MECRGEHTLHEASELYLYRYTHNETNDREPPQHFTLPSREPNYPALGASRGCFAFCGGGFKEGEELLPCVASADVRMGRGG